MTIYTKYTMILKLKKRLYHIPHMIKYSVVNCPKSIIILSSVDKPHGINVRSTYQILTNINKKDKITK